MERLHFGTRARQKARIKRAWLYAWIVTVVAAAAGIPGSGNALGFFDTLTGTADAGVLSAASTAVGPSEVAGFRGEFHKRRHEHVHVPKMPADWTEAEIIETIYAAAGEFGLAPSYLLGVAQCESTLNPLAYNSGGPGYHGLFQFDYMTWAEFGYGDIYDPPAQARTAAELLALGHVSRWPNCA
ncbi:MAG TPA: transglycosylase family protein [Actinomycetota bacterium]|nr:transglycosylase family protein [Actinomycetota bacterium]